MTFGYLASMKTRPGHRDEVAALLTGGSDGLRAAGCHLYLVAFAADDPDTICVTEVWESKAAHDASLELPAVRDAIARARPMLTGEFHGRELSVVGGLGSPA